MEFPISTGVPPKQGFPTHSSDKADKSEGGLGLVDGLVRKVVANVAGDSDRTVLPASSRFFSGMACSPPFSTYSLDLHNQLVTARSTKIWKIRYIYINLLFFHSQREPAIGFSLAICHLLPTYLQFIPLPSTSSCLGTIFSGYPLP